MPRSELIERSPGSGAVYVAAKLLFVLNAILLVGSYFAVPVYQKMHPGEVGSVEFVVFELLAVIDIAAAFLVLKGRWRIGIGLIALTSTVWCVGSVILQMGSGAQVSVPSVLVTAAVAYWDVALLGILTRRATKSGVASLHR
jgi:hypothetical protein